MTNGCRHSLRRHVPYLSESHGGGLCYSLVGERARAADDADAARLVDAPWHDAT
jgi:hypothetical protein